MLYEYLYFAIPVAAIVFFIVSLCLYLCGRKRSRLQPGSVSDRRLNFLKWLLIVSSVIAGVLAAVVIAFMALMFMAVAFM